MLGSEFTNDKSDQRADSKNAQNADEVRAEPVQLLPFVQHNLQTGNAERQVAHAPEIYFGCRAFDVARIEDKYAGQKHCQNSDRNIDVEDPSPAVAVGKPSSEHWAEHGGDHDTESPKPHGFAAILRRKDLHQDGLR